MSLTLKEISRQLELVQKGNVEWLAFSLDYTITPEQRTELISKYRVLLLKAASKNPNCEMLRYLQFEMTPKVWKQMLLLHFHDIIVPAAEKGQLDLVIHFVELDPGPDEIFRLFQWAAGNRPKTEKVCQYLLSLESVSIKAKNYPMYKDFFLELSSKQEIDSYPPEEEQEINTTFIWALILRFFITMIESMKHCLGWDVLEEHDIVDPFSLR